jgi:hypothetical protein
VTEQTTGERLYAELEAADDRAAAVRAEYDNFGLTQAQAAAWLNPGGRGYEADRARTDAALAFTQHCQRDHVTTEDIVLHMRFFDGRPPRLRSKAARARIPVAQERLRTMDRHADAWERVLDLHAAELGHDPQSPEAQAARDRALDQWHNGERTNT